MTTGRFRAAVGVFRSQALAAISVLALALNLIASVEPFLVLADWIHQALISWRELTSLPWVALFSFIDIELSELVAFSLSALGSIDIQDSHSR